MTYTLKLTFATRAGFKVRETRGLSWETAIDWRENLIAHSPALWSAVMTPETARR